jgi:2'-5' RNA ligase
VTVRQRMFVAVWPPPTVVSLLAGTRRPADPGLRWTSADQWHVTLRFLGGVDEEERDRLASAFHGLDLGAVTPVEAVLGPATRRFGDRVLYVPVAGLDAVAAAAVAATADMGEPPEDRAFLGHVTLARARGRGLDLRPLAGVPLSACWNVDEVSLVVSHTRPDGARYEVVDRRRIPG